VRQVLLQMDQVTKRYGPDAEVGPLSLSLGEGEWVVLTGPDGAGKTTALRLAAGVLAPSSGRVQRVEEGIGYVAAAFSLYPDLTAEENVRFFARAFGMASGQARAESERLLEWVGLGPHSHRLAGQLSGGMKKKLALVCAVVHRPKVLLMDEPTTGVDPVSREAFLALLHEFAAGGAAVLLSTQYMHEAEHAGRVVLLDRGHVLCDAGLSELRARYPHHVAEISGGSRSALLERAHALPGMVSAHPLGGRVRVVLREPVAGLEQAAPSLEDLFVWLAGDESR